MAYTTIDNPELYFQVKTYTGNGTAIGSGGQAITLDGEEDMAPDLVWIKDRSDSDRPRWFDSVRGVTKEFDTSDSTIETTLSEGLTAFGSDGFTVGNHEGVNSSSDSFVAWCWKESADAGFDIATWTGNGSNQTISHSLSAVPHFFITKGRTYASDWHVGHQAWNYSNDEFIHLNGQGGKSNTSPDNYIFNGTAPTSSVFSVGYGTGVNKSSETYIAYLWTEKQGYSKFGTYSGNGNADGTFVFCGFRPAFVLLKNTTGTLNWNLQDNKRWEGYNEVQPHLAPNLSAQEYSSSSYGIDILSNGFKIRNNLSVWNGSGNTLIYAAFAEQPFVNSNGVPCNAR